MRSTLACVLGRCRLPLAILVLLFSSLACSLPKASYLRRHMINPRERMFKRSRTRGETLFLCPLRTASISSKETFREVDIIARLGGDEFVVLALDAVQESAEIITDRIQTALELRNQQSQRPYQLNLSMGIARCDPETPISVSELIAQADSLIHSQKQARKGRH